MTSVESSREASSTTAIMAATPARTSSLLSNLAAVTTRVVNASTRSSRPQTQPAVRLVAVSKLKPASDILALHTSSTPAHLHFGENYLQELLEKSRLLPTGIRWHFIGGLQSNKCVTLARDVRGLWAVESVDSEKKASLLDKGWSERTDHSDVEDRLRVFVQVNTSGETNKAGVEPRDAGRLCRFVREKCPRLRLQGLMTIGAIARSRETTPENENEDFVTLARTREAVIAELGLEGEEADAIELSMGMSSDFEGAIVLGSDEVRVGTTIFGERPPKAEAKVV
jgi:pyridoxal phosphate enzyme (YggS family)